MQLTILGMILAVATALPLQERTVYCDQVHVDPGFGLGPACTPRPSSSGTSLPYCDEVHVEPGYGLGPACTPRDSSSPSSKNPNGLIDCKDVAIPAGFGPGPACYDSDNADRIFELEDSDSQQY